MKKMNTSKKSTLFALGLASLLLLASCDDGFETLNQNPNVYNDPVVESMFSYLLVKTGGHNDGNTQYPNEKMAGAMVQIFGSLNPWQWTGDKYLHKPEYTYGLWRTAYGVEVKQSVQLLDLLKDDPEKSNHYQIARIFNVYIFHRITDMYGDIPYSEAGKGYIDGTFQPKYDRQSDIYEHMLNELDEAAKALDPSRASFGSADFIYNGDPLKWRKFAYSLMLRLGMRLTKVDEGMAKEWVQRAIEGGVMESNDDMAILPHTDGTSNNYYMSAWKMAQGEGVPPSARGKGYGKMGQTFVEMLKNTNDPRLPFYITLWPGNADANELPNSTKPEIQKGIPNGYDYTTIKEVIPDWNDDMLAEYSEINLQVVAHPAANQYFQTFAEVKLLLAEAALRGWEAGDPKAHFEEAVHASMEMQALNPGGMSITPQQTDAFLAANPWPDNGTFEEKMERIHTEFYVSLFMNNMEIYSNWRRTGYPVLTPVNYPGNATGGQIPRRWRYDDSESSLNTENYNEAIANQGPDTYMTRVWWDVEE